MELCMRPNPIWWAFIFTSIFAKHSCSKKSILETKKQTKTKTEQTNNKQLGEWLCLCDQIQSGGHGHSHSYIYKCKQTKIKTSIKGEEQTKNEQMGDQIQSGGHSHSDSYAKHSPAKKCI